MLDDEVKKIGNKGDIVLQGDFNARTGMKNDFIQPDTFLDNLFENSGSSVDFSKVLPPRNSEDKQTNPRPDDGSKSEKGSRRESGTRSTGRHRAAS